MKILKVILFSTVCLTGIYESSASLSLEQIEQLKEAPRPLHVLRQLEAYGVSRGTPLYGRVHNYFVSSLAPEQKMQAVRGFFDALKAETLARTVTPAAPVVAEPGVPLQAAPVVVSIALEPAAPALQASRRHPAEVRASTEAASDELAASIGGVVVVSPTASVDDQVSPSKRVKSAPLATASVDAPQPMGGVVDGDAEALQKARTTLQSQIADLEGEAKDLEARYSALQSSLADHQKEKDEKQAALEKLQEQMRERAGELQSLFDTKENWRGDIVNFYGSFGVALLDDDTETASRLEKRLDDLMKSLYATKDPEAQEPLVAEIRGILGAHEKNPLANIFCEMGIFRCAWESTQGKPPFSTTLQSQDTLSRYQMVSGILQRVVGFSRALFEALDPKHLELAKITAKSSAVLGALSKNNEGTLKAFLKADRFEDYKKDLVAKNYGSQLENIISGLKDTALELESAKKKNKSGDKQKALAALTASGLKGDIANWSHEKVKRAIDDLADETVAQVVVESFKEMVLPQQYSSIMAPLTATWETNLEKRTKYFDTIKGLLAGNDQEIQALQGTISDSTAQAEDLGRALSVLEETLQQESQDLEGVAQEKQALNAQLQALRQQ